MSAWEFSIQQIGSTCKGLQFLRLFRRVSQHSGRRLFLMSHHQASPAVERPATPRAHSPILLGCCPAQDHGDPRRSETGSQSAAWLLPPRQWVAESASSAKALGSEHIVTGDSTGTVQKSSRVSTPETMQGSPLKTGITPTHTETFRSPRRISIPARSR